MLSLLTNRGDTRNTLPSFTELHETAKESKISKTWVIVKLVSTLSPSQGPTTCHCINSTLYNLDRINIQTCLTRVHVTYIQKQLGRFVNAGSSLAQILCSRKTNDTDKRWCVPVVCHRPQKRRDRGERFV